MVAKKSVKSATPEVDLSEFQGQLNRLKCSVSRALAELSDEQREKVEAALVAPHIRHDMIAKRLSEWTTQQVGDHTVGRHRNKKCSCG